MKHRYMKTIVIVVLGLLLAMPVSAKEIYVEKADQTPLHLDMEPGDQIDKLRTKINDAWNIAPVDQHLLFNGQTLEDGHTLADYNIQNESTIQLLLEKSDIRVGTVEGGSLLFYGSTDDAVNGTNAITSAAPGVGIYIKPVANVVHSVTDMTAENFTVVKSGGLDIAEARRRSGESPGVGKTISVSQAWNGQTQVPGIFYFTMPVDGSNVIVSATFPDIDCAENVTYIDKNGDEQTVAKAYILNGSETVLGVDGHETWYVCDTELTYTNGLTLAGDVHLILANGGQMAVYGFNGNNGTEQEPNCHALTIYGQPLSANFSMSTLNDLDALIVVGGLTGFSTLTINSGCVLAEGVGIVENPDDPYAKISANTVTINGGLVYCVGYIISTKGSTTLGWHNANTDRIVALGYDGNVTIASRFLTYAAGSALIQADRPSDVLHPVTLDSENDADAIQALAGMMLMPLDDSYTSTKIEYADGTVIIIESEGNIITVGNAQNGVLPCDGASITVSELNYCRNLFAPATGEEPATTVNGVGVNVYTTCLPVNPPTGTGIKYYKLSGATETTLRFTEITGTPVANTPYLVTVSTTANVSTTETLTNVTLQKETAEDNNSTAGNYVFKGTLTGLSNADAVGKYILQVGNKWGLVKDDTEAHRKAYIPQFRAYIEAVTTSGARPVLGTDFGNSDDATDIQSLQLIDSDGTERWYDLNGRRIDKPTTTQKGVYIQSGRKVVVK